MGKIRRERRKFHITREDKEATDKEANSSKNVTFSDSKTQGSGFVVPPDLFSGIDIPVDNLKTTLQDDARSVVSSSKKEFKKKGQTKKERKFLRHQTFINKINTIVQMKNDKKKKTKKKLQEDVPKPSTDIPVPKDSKPKLQKIKKDRSIPKLKYRAKKMLSDREIFKNLIKKKLTSLNALNNVLRK